MSFLSYNNLLKRMNCLPCASPPLCTSHASQTHCMYPQFTASDPDHAHGKTALGNTDLDHLDGLDGIVVAAADLGDLLDEVQVLGDLAEDGVSRGGGAIEPVQEGVVGDVDEELRATGLGLAGVGHREGPDVVGDARRELVGDATVVSAGDGLAIAGLEGGVGGGAASSGTVAAGILGVGATELVHEIRDNAVEVDAIVEAAVGKVDEVTAGDGHLVGVELGLEGAHLKKEKYE